MSKYDPLRDHLDRLPPERVQLTFSEIDRLVVGCRLRLTGTRPGGATNDMAAMSRRLRGWMPDAASTTSIRVTFTARPG